MLNNSAYFDITHDIYIKVFIPQIYDISKRSLYSINSFPENKLSENVSQQY